MAGGGSRLGIRVWRLKAGSEVLEGHLERRRRGSFDIRGKKRFITEGQSTSHLDRHVRVPTPTFGITVSPTIPESAAPTVVERSRLQIRGGKSTCGRFARYLLLET